MPVVNVDAQWLNRLVGRDLPAAELADTLEQIGCDVEEVTRIARGTCPGCGATVEAPAGAEGARACPFCGHASVEDFPALDGLQVIRLDLLAARPDLFDVGGLARALRGYLSVEVGLPDYTVTPGTTRLHVDPRMAEPASYRPHILGAVVTMADGLDEASLVALMKMQESLHWGVGRDRKLASIGVHDMDTVVGDVHYRPLDPDRERFEPLGMPGTPLTGREILEKHPKGQAYAHLLEGLAGYPVLVDDDGNVMSMPPVINGERTKLEAGSKRLFLDVTGISRAAVVKALDTLTCSLVEMGGTVESIEVATPDGWKASPDLAPRTMQIDLETARNWLGLPLDDDSLQECLRRMRFDVEPRGASGHFEVRYPPFRTDIRHQVDVLEDLAIGYRYTDIEPRLVTTMTPSRSRPEEDVSEVARAALLGLGYTEIMTLPMATEVDHFERLRLPIPEEYVRVANPKLKELKVVREHLLTGLLQALVANETRPLPLRLFEVDNVVRLDPEAENGVREERRITFVEISDEAGFATARSVADSLLRELDVEATYASEGHPTYLDGRCAGVTTGSGVHGRLGELHPEVIVAFGLEHPVAAGEITLARVW